MNVERRYVLITPCRDEAAYLRRTLECVVAQSVKPALWVIVDDGSTDETPRILAEYADRYDFIRVVHRDDRGERSVGPGVIEAFYSGLATVNLDDYDYVCKLDGDLEFGPEYFQCLFEKFEADGRLGTASGKSWIRTGRRLVPERTGDDFSQGQTKLYRVDCFRQIGGFVREVMWDGIDCHYCRMLGWKARSFKDKELRFTHLRPMGSSFKSILHGRLRWGRGQYFMGTHFLYALAITTYRAFERPWIIGGLLILVGYMSGYLLRLPRFPDAEFRAYLKQWQMQRLGLVRRGV